MIAVNKLIGGDPSGKNPGPGAPRVEADSVNMQLMVAGTAGQIDQVKQWLQKIGELPGGNPAMGAQQQADRPHAAKRQPP